MVIEHGFVTTLEGPQALGAAAEFLGSRGFVNAEQSAFPVAAIPAPMTPQPVIPVAAAGAAPLPAYPAPPIAGPGWTTLEMRRGIKNAARAPSIPDLPQSVRMEFDRGRLSIAISIPTVGKSFWTGAGSELPPHNPKVKPHVDLLMSIIGGLELLLAYRRPPQEAVATWDQLEAHLRHEGARRRRNSRIAITIAVVFAAAMVALMIVAIAMS